MKTRITLNIITFALLALLTSSCCLNPDELEEALEHPKETTKIKIKNCNLGRIPPDIGKLTNLEFLYLDHNQLDSLPSTIGNLQNLKHFYIGKNSLKRLPEEIAQLDNLIELYLVNSGPLLTIPPGIGDLKYLERLYVDSSVEIPYTVGRANPRLEIIVY